MSAEFVFVTFNNPNAHEQKDFKKKIRSQAATHSHRVAPRKGSRFRRFAAQDGPSKTEREETPTGPPDRETTNIIPPKSGTRSSPVTRAARKVRFDFKASNSGSTARRKKNTAPGLRTAETELIQANIGRKRTRSQSSPLDESGIRTAIVSQGRLPDPSYLDASQRDPFDTYPVPYQPWFGWLLDFWYAGTLPRARRLVKTTAEGINAYILWSRRFEMTEPALFYTSLFLATGIPVANGMLRVEKALWLRGQAVRALNEALSDPERATSNAVISSVGKIALHEHIYGDREAAHRIHRPAQQR